VRIAFTFTMSGSIAVSACHITHPFRPFRISLLLVTASGIAVLLLVDISISASLFTLRVWIMCIVNTVAMSGLCTIAAGHITLPGRPCCPLLVLVTASCIAFLIIFIGSMAHWFTVRVRGFSVRIWLARPIATSVSITTVSIATVIIPFTPDSGDVTAASITFSFL